MDKTPHEAFMEAAAVETLAMALAASSGVLHMFRAQASSRKSHRSEARRLIAEALETGGRDDG